MFERYGAALIAENDEFLNEMISSMSMGRPDARPASEGILSLGSIWWLPLRFSTLPPLPPTYVACVFFLSGYACRVLLIGACDIRYPPVVGFHTTRFYRPRNIAD